MRPDGNAFRVGLTVVAGVVVLAALIMMIGDQNFLFTATDSYFVRFRSVGGLAEDSPVQLNGVNVGKVDRIVLPENVDDELLVVWIKVEHRFGARIRGDSLARIKTLGLLGDKYVELTSGSSALSQVLPGEEIPAAQPTDVDALIASGEDVATKVVSTANSLSAILARMERGEGLLGELVDEREGGRVTDSLVRTLEAVERVMQRIESGQGTLGRLLVDEQIAENVASSINRLDQALDAFEQGDGLLPALINDGQTRERFDQLLSNADSTLSDLGEVTRDLRAGEGLLSRLLNDRELGERLTEQLQELLDKLNHAADRLTEGDGSVAQLVNDAEIYQALKDIVVGVEESKLLRWLIRNRQKAGIKKRYQDAQSGEEKAAPPGS